MSEPTCPIEEHGKICGKPAESRGWCAKHYMRWWKHGDPTKYDKDYSGKQEKCPVSVPPTTVASTSPTTIR